MPPVWIVPEVVESQLLPCCVSILSYPLLLTPSRLTSTLPPFDVDAILEIVSGPPISAVELGRRSNCVAEPRHVFWGHDLARLLRCRCPC